MSEKDKPMLTFERRVHNSIHWHYELDEQRDIWRCLWLTKQVLKYGERTAQWVVGMLCMLCVVGAFWQHYPQAAWISLALPFFVYKARGAYFLGAWYRVKLATLTNGKEQYYERVNELLAEACTEVEENEPTIDIEVDPDPEELL